MGRYLSKEVMKPIVIIPTYNERENLDALIPQVLDRCGGDILIVDDASPDGTGAIADDWSERTSRVQVLHRGTKHGLGRAYVAGFQWALRRDYTHVVEMDADLSHRPEDLPRLLARADQADAPDLVIGSRWVSGGGIENWPANRLILSRGSNIYVRMLTGVQVKDATAGFRVYRADTVRAVDLTNVHSHGYSFQVDMTLRVADLGGVIVEVPIVFVERAIGQSKMDVKIILESAYRTAIWGIKRRSRQFKNLAHRR